MGDNEQQSVKVKAESSQKPARKFAPRVPKRRPSAPGSVAVKVEAKDETATSKTPEQTPFRSDGGRLRREGRDGRRPMRVGKIFFESSNQKVQKGSLLPGGEGSTESLKQSKEEAYLPPIIDSVVVDDQDAREETVLDEDPLAPVTFAASRSNESRPPSTEREEDDTEMLRAASSPLYPNDGDYFVVQLPTSLPESLKRRPEAPESATPVEEGHPPRLDTDILSKLEPGPIGKLQIFESGNVKLLLGDSSFDVASALECSMLQQVASLSQTDFTILGNVANKILVTVPTDEDDNHQGHMPMDWCTSPS